MLYASKIQRIKNTGSKKVTQKKIDLIAKVIAFCLIAGFVSFFGFRSPVLQEISFLGLSIPAFMLFSSGVANNSVITKTFLYSFIYLVPITLSFFFHFFTSGEGNIVNVVLVFNLFLAFYLASVFASCSHPDFLQSIMRYTAMLAMPIFMFIALTQQHSYHFNRWEPYQLQPNWWGMMALGCSWGVISFKNMKLRVLGIIAIFLFLVALQARGSIVALIPAVALSSGYFFPLTKHKIGLFSLGFVFMALMDLFLYFSTGFSIIGKCIDYIANDVLLLNDAYRGVGTGMSGRAEGYIRALNGFLASPVWGSGFGQFGFVHNGFLLTLAESGILGLFGMLALLVRSFYTFLKEKDWFMLGFFLSYVVALLTFPRSFNINMTGFIFMVIVMKGCAAKSIEKKKYNFV